MNAEGWYQDPFHRHEARWISAGTPTALVRDGEVESQDPPPGSTFEGELQPLPDSEPADGEDLLRADAAESAPIFDPNAGVAAVWDTFGEAGGGD
jgi:hypothetical protein